MTKTFRSGALCALFIAALALPLTACGGGMPDDAVATVDEQTIKQSTFDHWMKIVAISSAQQAQGATTQPTAQVPDAPDFEQCIANKRKTAKAAKGQPEQTDAQHKQACKTQYDGLKKQVLSYLIRSTWLDQEAGKQGVKLADKDVQKQIDAALKQNQLEGDAYQKFLRRSGLTESDIFFQQRTQLLEQKITEKITKGKDKVTDAQIQAYYDKNKDKFAQPERRDLRIVLTKTKARAEQAKAALDGGQSWSSVAKQYSTDAASKSQGGQLLGISKGQQEKAFDTAVFGAKKGTVTGPLKTQFGWYVFEVTKVTESSQQSLKDSRETIKQTLATEGQQKALTTFGDDYRKRWKEATDCRKDFVVDDCKNAPKPKASTTPTTGTDTTQQQP